MGYCSRQLAERVLLTARDVGVRALCETIRRKDEL